MKNLFIVAILATLFFSGTDAFADPAKTYKQLCTKCHGELGEWWSKSAGPDLTKSKYNLDQFTKQVLEGSKWKGKPRRSFKYRSRQMPAVTNISDDEIEMLYEWLKKQN